MIFASEGLTRGISPEHGYVNMTGQKWIVRFWWNERLNEGSGGWCVDLFYPDFTTIKSTDTDGNALPRGVVVHVSDDLWEPYRHLATFPPGRLAAYRTDGGNAGPGLTELGTTFIVEYIEPSAETSTT